MPSTTSGETTFDLDVDEIIEQALDNVGGDYTNANDQHKARRTLNLILIELQNKNIPLSKIGESTVDLLASTGTYTLTGAVSDVIGMTLKDINSDTENQLERTSRKDFHQVSNKNQTGRPTLYVTDRTNNKVKVTLWPIPDKDTTYALEVLTVNRIEDINASYQKLDLPYRYLPLIITWLSYKLSLTKANIPMDVKATLKQEYTEIMMDAFDEDRERVDMYIIPGGISGR